MERTQESQNAFAMAIQMLVQVSKVWEVPISILLELTIQKTMPSEWNRFYGSANLTLYPLALLYSCSSFIPLDRSCFSPTSLTFPFMVGGTLCEHLSCACTLHCAKGATRKGAVANSACGFHYEHVLDIDSAGELLFILAAIGTILDLPTPRLVLIVLTWGNSIGDLVSDVTVAKAGQPAMAVAGCFVCPMFYMLVVVGTGLVKQAWYVYPMPFELPYHVSLVVDFIFLLLSLMGSLLVLTWFNFRVPLFWGFCLVGLLLSLQ